MSAIQPLLRLEELAGRIIVLEGWRASILAGVSGALTALALAPYHFSPIIFLTFPILVWLLDGAVAPAGSGHRFGIFRRFWPAFKIGWCFGFGYFLAGFWWVGQAFLVDAEEFLFLLPIAVVALPAGLALFWGGAAAMARLAWGNGWVRLVAFAASLAFWEWLRGTMLTGLPWNTPGYAAMPVPLLMQSASVFGLYGITFFTILVAAVPAIIAPGYGAGRWRAAPILVVGLTLLFGHVILGMVSLSGASTAVVDGVKIRVVQPAIDQSKKWDIGNEAEIMQRYLDLSNSNKGPQEASAAAFTHIIWPESAFPFILTQRRDQLAKIAQLLPASTSLITGAMRLEKAAIEGEQPKVFNSLYLINSNGEIVVARDKTRLLPFGEFLPFQSFLEGIGLQQLTQLRGGFAQGNRRSVVAVPGTPAFLPLICYEIIFSGAVMPDLSEGDQRPKWIVNLTNDAWFGMTAGPYQHAHQAQVRAVEEGLPVIRAANNGISFIADAYGRVQEQLALGARGVVDGPLPAAIGPTPFAQYGNRPILIFVCLLFLCLVVVKSRSTNEL